MGGSNLLHMSKPESGDDTVLGVEGLIEREAEAQSETVEEDEVEEETTEDSDELEDIEEEPEVVDDPAEVVVDSSEGMPGTAADLDLDETDEEDEVETDETLTLAESMTLVAPYALIAVGAATAGAAYLSIEVPMRWALAPLALSGLGLIKIMRSEPRETETYHRDERDCMLPACDGTIKAVERGAVIEEPECRSCGTRYDIEVALTDPEEYLDVTREGSSGTPAQALADADPEDDEDEETDSRVPIDWRGS